MEIDEKQTLFPSQTLASRPQRTRSWLLWLWRVTITVVALGWIIPLYRQQTPRKLYGVPENSPFPPEVFQRVKKVFYPDERYIGPSNDTHRNWDHLVAAHDALYIENPADFGLPKGIKPPFNHPGKIDGGPSKFYVITGLHQMHCLVSPATCHAFSPNRIVANKHTTEHRAFPLLPSQDRHSPLYKLRRGSLASAYGPLFRVSSSQYILRFAVRH